MSNDIQALYAHFLQSTGVTTDSRNCPQGSLFIALKGTSFNGNAFAEKALEAGCSHVVVDEAAYYHADDTRYTLVTDGLKTLQALANYHRRQLGTPLIGITGTNGKTTTKELIAAVLSQKYQVLYTQGNLNNSIGVPLTVLGLKKEHQLGVIEMGASHPGDIKELVDVAEPNYGIITNVGKAHLLGFGSFEGVIRTKGELYDFLRGKGNSTIFIDHDNSYLQNIAGGLTKVEYGTEEGLDVTGRITGNSPFLALEWKERKDSRWHAIQTQLIGSYNFTNVLAAITIGRYFQVDAAKIDAAITQYAPQNNRSQLQKTAHNTLIIDAYNANPTSMHAALENFQLMEAEHKMLILGQMGELGNDCDIEHQKVVDYIDACNFEEVLLVGEHFAKARHAYPTYPDTPSLIAALQQLKPIGKTILIKGSNSNKLSTIVDYL
ncbi:MAG: UDP-N-acetylmuramoyl-tripeptide--D-alanyl-D-alanine ligase [Bacteroidaceae bacterium]|nr:UDP-N-acetylmuramoyl-tripeptide--D-alanyl-D-alanine ligase [Bacteroidaceae bacterium]